MNNEQDKNTDQYKNAPIKRLPIKQMPIQDPDIQPVGGIHASSKSRLKIKPIILDSKTKPPWHRRIADNIGPLSILGLIILIIVYIWLSLGSYFDPLSMCRIRIHADLVAGNKKTIIQGLKLLKKEDRASYALACKYVDRIYERTCIGADWHLDKSQPGSQEPGCYVKGSKSIYLKPNYRKDDQAIVLRKDSIKKYSRLSQEYWEN